MKKVNYLILGLLLGITLLNLTAAKTNKVDTIDYQVLMVAYQTGWYNGAKFATIEMALYDEIKVNRSREILSRDSTNFSNKILNNGY